ncbi:histidine kinase [Kutzneria kofuensis]|uniref:Na+/proline symporter n=1 Tax=Kutzneria kofuensis TaxID=103725 RepID=A0A7W9KMX9_9PSEU|nr:histidine kinase [Kutzneria kofuensis]MBB5895420.1 Na+/proline symporter [Kutzneria kofuensis]
MQTWVVVLASVAYLGTLFAVAFHGDRRADKGRSVINNGWVYSLSLAVYATSWTYYGGVGSAATVGVGFLPIYLGPTIMLTLGWLVLRRIIRISKRNRITSLADFVSARYGKSSALGGLVAVMAVIGIVPYISLQLKAVSQTFEIIRRQPAVFRDAQLAHVPLLQDTALYVALLLAGFTILFGTRHLDATERHEGMVAAVAFEAVVKFIAFVAVGVFVTFFLYDGFGDLFSKASQAGLGTLFTLHQSSATWIWQNVLSALAIIMLPRQWQIGVVENVAERHVKRAMWAFPLYLLTLSLFVLPIAAAGLLRLSGSADADAYVLALPISGGQEALALLVFLGGLSAATGMIIVETVALSTMVSNSLVLPVLLKTRPKLATRTDLGPLILGIRRATIVAVMLLGFGYFRVADRATALASIGLVSFAAVAQFAPAILGGLFWKGGTRAGALTGLSAGFAVWAYTSLLPTFAEAGWLPTTFLQHGPFGIDALRPQALFGVSGMDSLSHTMFWSLVFNLGGYIAVSVFGRPSATEQAQAVLFVDALHEPENARRWRGRVAIGELRALLERFLGPKAATAALGDRSTVVSPATEADPAMIQHVETVLAGAVGAASARILVASVVGEEQLSVEKVIEMIDEASEVAALEERHRLARELHDSVSQALFSMTLHTRAVELAAQREGCDPDGPIARGLIELRSLTQGALSEMRASLFQLRPGALHEDGLTEAIRKQATAIATRENVTIKVDAPDARLPLDERAEDELFRVVQEAVHNSVKHASPHRIDIRLCEHPDQAGALLIEVADDGAGFDPTDTREDGMGLPGMRERLARLGGLLVVDSAPGRHTTVQAVLPGALHDLSNQLGERR